LKPARVLTAGDKTGDESLLDRAKAYHAAALGPDRKGFLAPLHFLDRPVSGVVMFARSSKAAARISDQFRRRTIHKVYQALVCGVPPAPSGTLEDYLSKDEDSNVTTVARAGDRDAKACKLSYRLLSRHGALSLLEVTPETGRSHQIRVQLASRGMAIFGDRKYGGTGELDGAIALHAASVTFAHPISGEKITVNAPIPAVWNDIMHRAARGGRV
jgi:23S rRNA pseudouridine1911/1915/1917 synthase